MATMRICDMISRLGAYGIKVEPSYDVINKLYVIRAHKDGHTVIKKVRDYSPNLTCSEINIERLYDLSRYI